jgi:hypothetical protein
MRQSARVRAQQTLECGKKLGVLHELLFEPIGKFTSIMILELRGHKLVEHFQTNARSRILSLEYASCSRVTLTRVWAPLEILNTLARSRKVAFPRALRVLIESGGIPLSGWCDSKCPR